MRQTRVLCLNCGSLYDPEGDCPNLEDGEHSREHAVRVARYLQDRGCFNPRPLDVRDASNALEAIDRG